MNNISYNALAPPACQPALPGTGGPAPAGCRTAYRFTPVTGRGQVLLASARSLDERQVMPTIYQHIRHPRIAAGEADRPVRVTDFLPRNTAVNRFNTRVAVLITQAVGSMWCAYAFALFDLISLPAAIRGGPSAVVTWVAQTFLQLVLLSVIMVGQNVQAAAACPRAARRPPPVRDPMIPNGSAAPHQAAMSPNGRRAAACHPPPVRTTDLDPPSSCGARDSGSAAVSGPR